MPGLSSKICTVVQSYSKSVLISVEIEEKDHETTNYGIEIKFQMRMRDEKRYEIRKMVTMMMLNSKSGGIHH